ncbi:aminotransferase class I/II-fold pyridoxal phosphate-dependent enzyme [Paenibacillus nicotianae]|uniref:Aminotransferase class I/II-fold pyridoxal phosphate-dependent enzyme n=1 Tax=Paenibacillus nicotianae TaxID=1526551 RepID=A0ABW4UT28_9BACL
MNNTWIPSTTKQCKAPLYDALSQYASSPQKSFHVPGHKNGMIYTDVLQQMAGLELFYPVLQWDVTEISGTDDLHHPEGVIQEAQQLAAQCFGAEESHFLVGGSTVGNLALILTVCSHPGDIIIVQRNVHKSVLNGLMIAGAKAVFLTPETDHASGLAVIPSMETIEAALIQYPTAKAVFLSSPNYYGMGKDLSHIAATCHRYQIPLLVDEAHGAHYGHHHRFPTSALNAGADGVVQSTHKMLSAMTMSAMVHVQGDLLHRSLLKQRLTMVQSSSPSYPLMASLDLSRYLLDCYGEQVFDTGLQARDTFIHELEHQQRFGCLSFSEGNYTQDPFKVVIYDRNGCLSGEVLQERLEYYGCVPEMSDDRYVVLVFSMGSTLEDSYCLLEALTKIAQEPLQSMMSGDTAYTGQHSKLIIAERTDGSEVANDNYVQQKDHTVYTDQHLANLSEPILFTLTPIAEDKIEVIPLEQAEGRICAEMVIPYPPGIPILYAGETIHPSVYASLLTLRTHGHKIQGTADATLNTLRVYQ